jgi:hypothetical protein
MVTISCCLWQLLLQMERMVIVGIGLERLKQMVVGDVLDVCVIHDRHKGILQAISDIKEGSKERYKAAQWPDVHSRWFRLASTRTKNLQNCSSASVRPIRRRNSSTCGKN